jgi:prohibitin 1
MAQLLAQQLSRLLQISLGVGLGLLGLSKSVYIVPPGHRAVIWDRLKGVKMGVVKSEGMHLLIPFWQTPYIMDVRKTPKNINTTSPSKDLQTVKITLRVLYRPNKKFLPQLFNEYGEDYDERLLPSLGNDVLKAVVVMSPHA